MGIREIRDHIHLWPAGKNYRLALILHGASIGSSCRQLFGIKNAWIEGACLFGKRADEVARRGLNFPCQAEAASLLDALKLSAGCLFLKKSVVKASYPRWLFEAVVAF